jgi:hypothetical protein
MRAVGIPGGIGRGYIRSVSDEDLHKSFPIDKYMFHAHHLEYSSPKVGCRFRLDAG